MPFYRFEQFESRLLTPHLSSGAAPVIEGRYMYFCLLPEQKLDTMGPEEQARARIERKAN
jgi:hypothetical protein